jgi:hypothetical protein
VIEMLVESAGNFVSQLEGRQSFRLNVLNQGQRNLAVGPDDDLTG